MKTEIISCLVVIVTEPRVDEMQTAWWQNTDLIYKMFALASYRKFWTCLNFDHGHQSIIGSF